VDPGLSGVPSVRGVSRLVRLMRYIYYSHVFTGRHNAIICLRCLLSPLKQPLKRCPNGSDSFDRLKDRPPRLADTFETLHGVSGTDFSRVGATTSLHTYMVLFFIFYHVYPRVC